MAILHLSIRPSEPYIFAIFKPTIFKFWNLKGDDIRINDKFGFSDSLSINYEIELGFESIYFGSSNQKKIKKLIGAKKNKMADKISEGPNSSSIS
jgi:hypothetical protein